jgi:hypothetical protein
MRVRGSKKKHVVQEQRKALHEKRSAEIKTGIGFDREMAQRVL